MKYALAKSRLTAAFAVVVLAATVRAEDAKSTEPLALQLPAPTLKGTPEDLPAGPNPTNRVPPSQCPRA